MIFHFRTMILIVFLSLFTAAAYLGDGSSKAEAVIIKERKSESNIRKQENKWLSAHYPGWTEVSVNPENDGVDKYYNIRVIKTVTGEERSIWFDVSLFYTTQLEKSSRKYSRKRVSKPR